MNANKPPYIQETGTTRSFSMYPGLGPGGAPYGGQMYESQLPATIQPHQAVPVQPPAGGGGGLGGFLSNLGGGGGGGGGGLGGLLGNLGGSLSNFKLTDIKAMVDRMGGIDGVMSTVGKVQKIMTTVKQMQPMIKLLMGSFSKTSSDDDDDDVKRRRRRRKRKNGKRRTVSRPLNKVRPVTKKKRPRR